MSSELIVFIGAVCCVLIVLIITVTAPDSADAKKRDISNLQKRLKSLPEESMPAVVISKTSEISKTLGNASRIDTAYYIAFRFPDGSRKNFSVDVNAYNTAMENDTGELTYKQRGGDLLFIRFQPQA